MIPVSSQAAPHNTTLGKCILVIEPSPSIRQLLDFTLCQGGHQVISVASAAEGLAIVRNTALRVPDLIFLAVEYQQRKEDFVLLNLLKHSHYYQQTVLAVLTDGNIHRSWQAMLPEGRSVCLTKPFTIEQILRLAAGTHGVSPGLSF
jgi:CheY-like chemotaxis protein